MSLEEVEAFLIKKAMGRYDGNVSQAARALGLSPAPCIGASSAMASKTWYVSFGDSLS